MNRNERILLWLSLRLRGLRGSQLVDRLLLVWSGNGNGNEGVFDQDGVVRFGKVRRG